MKHTKDLLQYLSSKSGLPLYDEIRTTVEENLAKIIRQRLFFRIQGYEYRAHLAAIKGGTKVLRPISWNMDSPFAGKDIPITTPIDKIFYKKYRGIEDFGVEYKTLNERYKHDEGNGWYSYATVIMIDDIKFALT